MTAVRTVVRRWRPAPALPDPAVLTLLARELRLPEPMCRLLAVRGLLDPAAARAFLRPSLGSLHDPYLLTDMDVAVERLVAALDRRETILVHGDYDVDGMCAAALLTRVLLGLGGQAVPFVPHRVRHGYDLGQEGIRRAVDADSAVILTADCGIVAHEAVQAAGRAGLDVIITDHHTPGRTLPQALAVIDPKRSDCFYPNAGLCGTGVAYKLAVALAAARGVDPEAVHYHLDLVALATVADVMPLTGENRVLTRFGLRVLERTRNEGLRALIRGTGLADRRIASGHLSHVLAPRLNAVGRLEDAATGLELLLSEGDAGAGLAAMLESTNTRRQAVDREILAQAMELLDGRYEAARDRAVVLASRGWHPGVIGIVASRIVERLHRPTILIALPDGPGMARGSARSIPGFDLLDSIRACGDHLERYGGHAAAAGFDIEPDRVEGFRAAFAERARSVLPEEPVPELRIDAELSLSEVTPDLVRYLVHVGPFGVGNPTPVFAFRGVRISEARTVGADGHHLRVRIADGDASLRGIGFRMAETHGAILRSGEVVDVAAQLQEDTWNGRRRIQARLVDARPAD